MRTTADATHIITVLILGFTQLSETALARLILTGGRFLRSKVLEEPKVFLLRATVIKIRTLAMRRLIQPIYTNSCLSKLFNALFHAENRRNSRKLNRARIPNFRWISCLVPRLDLSAIAHLPRWREFRKHRTDRMLQTLFVSPSHVHTPAYAK